MPKGKWLLTKFIRIGASSQVPLRSWYFDDDVCLNQGHQNTRACSFAARLARSGLYQWGDGTPAGLQTRSAPGQDTRSGQGALARRHTDGPLRAALLKTTVMCEAWHRRTIAPPNPSRTADRPNPILLITGSSIPIPVPGQYRLSRCLE